MCFLTSSTQNHAESFRNFLKKSVWDPRRAKLYQNSDFGHVRTYSRLHKLRNTQGKIYKTDLGNNMETQTYGNTGTAFAGAPIGSVFLIMLNHTFLWIFLSYSCIFLYLFFEYSCISLGCILIYSINSCVCRKEGCANWQHFLFNST